MATIDQGLVPAQDSDEHSHNTVVEDSTALPETEDSIDTQPKAAKSEPSKVWRIAAAVAAVAGLGTGATVVLGGGNDNPARSPRPSASESEGKPAPSESEGIPTVEPSQKALDEMPKFLKNPEVQLPTSDDPLTLVKQLMNNYTCALNAEGEIGELCIANFVYNPSSEVGNDIRRQQSNNARERHLFPEFRSFFIAESPKKGTSVVIDHSEFTPNDNQRTVTFYASDGEYREFYGGMKRTFEYTITLTLQPTTVEGPSGYTTRWLVTRLDIPSSTRL